MVTASVENVKKYRELEIGRGYVKELSKVREIVEFREL